MANDWMIDVMTDLRAYALNNGLPALASQLDEAILVAAMEFASVEEMVADVGKRDHWTARSVPGKAAIRPVA